MKKKLYTYLMPSMNGIIYQDKDGMLSLEKSSDSDQQFTLILQSSLGVTVATSSPHDSALNIPLGFIEKYCHFIIPAVMVTYDSHGKAPLTRRDNTVIISKIREMFTRDEIHEMTLNLYNETNKSKVNNYLDML